MTWVSRLKHVDVYSSKLLNSGLLYSDFIYRGLDSEVSSHAVPASPTIGHHGGSSGALDVGYWLIVTGFRVVNAGDL